MKEVTQWGLLYKNHQQLFAFLNSCQVGHCYCRYWECCSKIMLPITWDYECTMVKTIKSIEFQWIFIEILFSPHFCIPNTLHVYCVVHVSNMFFYLFVYVFLCLRWNNKGTGKGSSVMTNFLVEKKYKKKKKQRKTLLPNSSLLYTSII